jgi:membrane peptidoglycan carboxypeptidase
VDVDAPAGDGGWSEPTRHTAASQSAASTSKPTFRERRRARRAAKKARIRAMSRPKRFARRGMILGTWLLGLVAALLVTTIVLFYALTDVPRPETLPLPQVATIEYSDGSTLARIGSVDRTIVDLNQVPKHVQWAVIAAEDRGFYREPGVSVKGTLRAAWSDVTGGDTQGGSGITQQYVKNAYLNNAQTLSRKLKELMISVKLSRQYSKDQILAFYLNTVYFGRGAYGIQAAAETYFGKNVEQLSVAQGALLAGLLRAPAYYDPATDPAQAHDRWRYVLDGMEKIGKLTAPQEAALAFPTTKAVSSTGLGTTGWRYLLTNRVLAELADRGISATEVNDRGLVIRTTIDRKAQQAAVQAVATTFHGLTKKQRNLKNSLVAVNPKTGGVLAYYGGSGPGVKGNDGTVDYNDWAGQRANPAGSAFKPYTLATVLTQTLKQTPGKSHVAINSYVDGSYCARIEGTKICNDPADRSISGPRVQLKKAMKFSLNTTFDMLAVDADPTQVAKTAHAMGVATTDSEGHKTLVGANGQTTFGIGIGDYPVTTLDQATGFATLANNGVHNNAYLVQSATASDGGVVYQHQATPVGAIDPRVANDVTMTLKPIAKYSGDSLSNGRGSAAKTGTVGIGTKTTNNSDAWMVGFTPEVSTAVWVGTGYRKPIYNAAGKPLYGSDLPGKTWKLFMDTYLKGQPNKKLASTQQIGEDGMKPTPSPTQAPSTSRASSSSTDRPQSSYSVPSQAPSSPSAPASSAPSTPTGPSPSRSTTRNNPPSPGCSAPGGCG